MKLAARIALTVDCLELYGLINTNSSKRIRKYPGIYATYAAGKNKKLFISQFELRSTLVQGSVVGRPLLVSRSQSVQTQPQHHAATPQYANTTTKTIQLQKAKMNDLLDACNHA